MITIEDTEFTSDIKLCDILNVLTKNKIVAIITKLDEYISPNAYIARKMRKMPYKLQKYALVLTHENYDTRQWEMLMSDEVREAFASHIDEAIAYKEKYPRKMTRKEKCMAALMECWMREKTLENQ